MGAMRMNDFTVDQFMSILPGPIEKSEHMTQLAEVAAKALKLYGDFSNSANLYSRIDELPEEVLDILAKDLAIEWYEYDKPVQVKRNQIKSAWYVHRKLGTVGAVKQALSDVWPPSTVEEWWEYGGDPYMFRVALNASNVYGPIYIDEAIQAVRYYKPARSHMDGPPVLKVSFGIIVNTAAKNALYHVTPTGTTPRWATHGNKNGNGTEIRASAGVNTYSVRPCGTSLNALM